LPARFLAQDGLQLHRRGEFVLSTFHRDRDDHGVDAPQRERQRDIFDTVGKAKPDAAAGRQLKRPQLSDEGEGILNQVRVGNRVVAFNQRHSFGPVAGGFV
jgi:hypothetical protein